MSGKRAPSLKDAKKCGIFNRSESSEKNSIKSPTFSSLVLLAMNLKKSPWLLSRCKKTFNHVQFAQTLLKDSDSLKVIVKLMRTQRISFNDERYLVLISSFSDEKEEMNLLLGINVVNEQVTVGLILPITMETDICLDGDGGFFVSNAEWKYSFQPISIQEMWSALQALVKCVFSARSRKCQQVVLSQHYKELPRSEAHQVCEWERVTDALSSKTNEIVSCESKESCQLKVLIRRKLQEILVNTDLDTVTSKEIRDKLEEKLKMNVQQGLGLSTNQYKQFIDEETILAMRQMDSPSQILDFLYLGSEWNASNFEELKRNRIGYILNVTKEIENFFPGMFKYCNVQVYDYEETELLRHWNSTFKFISEAMSKNSNILVHCKMGISRSASTVIAFIMKYKQWDVEEAYQFVKQKRSCIQPNPGFMQQLITYQGILDASNHRHNKLFRSKSISSLDKINKKQSKNQKVRPKSNAEERKVKVNEVCETLEASRDLETSDLSDKFIIVDADDACLSAASETCKSLDAQPDESIVIDESTLSTSSVLRQWSTHSLGSPQSGDKVEEKEVNVDIEDIFEENGETSLQKFFQNSKKRFCSWPGELNVQFAECTEDDPFTMPQDEVAPLKQSVKFALARQKKNEKRWLKRHHSMFQE